MKVKKPGEAQVVLRIEPKDKQDLEREAKAGERSLGAYIRHLLNTHPARPKKKG